MESRIGENIEPQANGCWIYRERPNQYGRVSVRGQTVLVHRFVYEKLMAPIPPGIQLHHLCETPGCCNPEHLAEVTPDVHAERHAELRRKQTLAPAPGL